MDEKNENRIIWIDITRALLIIAVVWGHVYSTGFFREWLYSFHVPGFFFISGCCFKYIDDFGYFLKKKIKMLVVPYFFFSLLSIFMWWILSLLWNNISDILECNLFINILIALYGNSKPDIMRYNLPLWFLPCLFSVNIIAYWIKKTFTIIGLKFGHILLIICFLLGIFFTKHENIALPWHIETAISMVIWFMMGYGLFTRNILTNIEKFINNKLFIGIIFIVIGAGLSFVNSCVIGVRNEHYGIIPIYYISAFLGIIGIILISQNVKKNIFLEFIGMHTLDILVIHKFIVICFQKVATFLHISLIYSDTVLNITIGFCITIVAIGMSLVICNIIKKMAPWAVGR